MSDNAATMTKNWDAETDDKLLSCIAQCKDEVWREAFSAFYHRHKDYLYGICYNLANRYKFGFFDENDAFQETMEKVRERANTFKSEGVTDAQELQEKADAWLGGIAENVVFDLIRRKPKCVPLIYENLDDDGSEINGTDENAFEVPASVEFDECEKTILVREAIETLSPNEQAVIPFSPRDFGISRREKGISKGDFC